MGTKNETLKTPQRRRQWGSDKSTDPMAIMHAKPSGTKIVLGRLAIMVTILSWTMYVITTVMREFVEN